MIARTTRCTLALAGLVLAPPALTLAAPPQQAAPAPRVEVFVERALAQAPSLAARRARVESARTASLAAGTLPDPMVEFEYRDAGFPRYTIGSEPMSMAGASVRQTLLGQGRRQAQRDVAQAVIGQRRAEQDVVAADLATAVRVQYARLYAIDHERETLASADELTALLEATVSSRYATGQGDQAGILRIQLERTRLGQRLVDLAAERADAQATLNRLTNDPPDTPIGIVAALPPDGPLPPDLAGPSLSDEMTTAAPAVAVRSQEVNAATRQAESARQELRPTWSVGGGFYWQGGFDRTVSLTVGVELPLRKARKQLPLIAAAEQEAHAAQLDVQDAAAEVRAEARRLVAAWQAAGEQIERYRTAVLPQNSAAFDATRSSYLAGRGDFASILEEFRRWIEVRIDLGSREAQRYAARARLDGLLGRVGQVGQ